MANFYTATCFVKNDNGKYHMECDMNYDKKHFYADYDGDNFEDGMNTIIEDISEQMTPKKTETTVEVLEDRIANLEATIQRLQVENAKLKNKTKPQFNDYNTTSTCWDRLIDELLQGKNN